MFERRRVVIYKYPASNRVYIVNDIKVLLIALFKDGLRVKL